MGRLEKYFPGLKAGTVFRCTGTAGWAGEFGIGASLGRAAALLVPLSECAAAARGPPTPSRRLSPHRAPRALQGGGHAAHAPPLPEPLGRHVRAHPLPPPAGHAGHALQSHSRWVGGRVAGGRWILKELSLLASLPSVSLACSWTPMSLAMPC